MGHDKETEMTKKNKFKCAVCRKKINKLVLAIYQCRCGIVLCSAHKRHACTFNYSTLIKPLQKSKVSQIVPI